MKMNKTKRRARRTKRRSLRRVGGVVLTKNYPDKNRSITANFTNPKKKIVEGDIKIQYYSGETYVGPCNYKLNAHGRGRATFPDGTVYVGEFKDDDKSGHGRIDYADGSSYEGGFDEDAPHGQGIYTTANGVYEGQLDHSFRHGIGKMTFPNGAVYEGVFNRDKITGPGVLIRVDGTVVHEGKFRDTDHGLVGVGEIEDELPPMDIVAHPDFDPAQAAALHAQADEDMKAHNEDLKSAQSLRMFAESQQKKLDKEEILARILSGEYADAPASVIATALKFQQND